jgi:aryl-alcohol dehydrogenase-like predicted oxidoreductase
MRMRALAGRAVAEIGFGCMNLSHGYGPPASPEQAEAVLLRAVERGVTLFDTASLYGFGRNETLVGRVLKPHRQEIFLASKCGMTGVDGKRVIDGRPETLKRTCDESLARLQTDTIDLYYLHRWDKSVPIEESVGGLADLVAAGKIRSVGLSEVSAATLRRAHAVHPIAAVQSEYSLWTRNPEVALLDACRELGVALVAFSPVGRGFLAGAPADPAGFGPTDFRLSVPRFHEPHLGRNLALLARLQAIGEEAGYTTAQLAIAWLLARDPIILPIPGTTSVAHLEEDLRAAELPLSPELATRLDALINPRTVSGARYSDATQREIDTEEIPLEAA